MTPTDPPAPPPPRPSPPSHGHPDTPSRGACKRWLDLAARHAARAAGYAEPNPLVGCVVVPASVGCEVGSEAEARALASSGRVGVGHHRVFGGPHAEVDALAACDRLGLDTRGATAFVTLEPCDSWGKTGPCSVALERAGVSRVVFAREDPAQSGASTLRRAGIGVVVTDASERAMGLSAPFVHRLQTGLPWVIAKWAQTLDGRAATSTGESQWLTGPRARRSAHALRARVDAILTGIGTVLHDDPLLTAREVFVRRRALRVVIDPRLELPTGSRLAQHARGGAGVLVVTGDRASKADERRLTDLGVRVHRAPSRDGEIDLRATLGTLATEFGVATLMTECGPRLLGRLMDAGLVNELRAYVAPMVMGDPEALPAFVGASVGALAGVTRWRLALQRPIGNDVELRYVRPGG